MICWRYTDEEHKISIKHFFTSVKPETKKMAKTTRFSQKVKPMRPLRMAYGCSMILY